MLAKTRQPPLSFAETMSALDRMTRQLRDEREAREAQREVAQLTAAAIEPPMYDNREVECRYSWIATNGGALVAYARALGIDTTDTDELRTFIEIQRDRVLINRQAREQRYADCVRYQRRMNRELGVHEQSGQHYQGEL